MVRKSVIFGFLGFLSKLVSALLQRWPLMLVIAFFLSSAGPHVRWEYTYRDVYGHRAYLSCTYVGSRGFITPDYIEGCPALVWLDAREWRR